MNAPMPRTIGWLAALLSLAALSGCGSSPSNPPASAAPAATSNAAPLRNSTAATPTARPSPAPKGSTARTPSEVRTRNAMFKLAQYDELPGWQDDDMRASWSAFRNSCDVLQKREHWRQICADAKTVAPSSRAMRVFFESQFTLLRILHTDARGDGDVTGYFEPMLEGQMQRDGEFNTPVLGVPRSLFTIDWARVPKAQRDGVVRVRPEGSQLVVAAAGSPGTYALDLRRFVLDDRDRRLRLRLVGAPGTPEARVEPYYSRAELETLGLPQGIDAPVVVWVNDPLALYAMQVQGSGRVRMPDGQVLRLQYAEQNGHPFKPLRVVAKASPRVTTRGLGDSASTPDSFVLEADEADNHGNTTTGRNTDADDAPVLTRGGSALPGRAATSAAPAPRAAPKADPLVDELLKGSKKPAPPRPSPPPKTGAVSRLSADPSYVFFKTVADRPSAEGPQGALGVPLTPGRSVAVDPRVTPLGYPVFLSAPAPKGSSIGMQRLVFAQDTGGAIRGAVRADYFWGYGHEAGQMARSTKHRGQMWVMLPNAEAARLSSSKLVTRGMALGGGTDGDSACLVPDGEFCDEVD